MFESDWRVVLGRRPWWMNALFAFCLFMTIVYMPFDLFWKSVANDEEVWLGFMLRGWAAKLTEPLHWAIYAAGAYGFWKMRPWMWPWAAVYSAQVSLGMLVWNLRDARGRGVVGGVVAALVFLIPTVALWQARATFQGAPAETTGASGPDADRPF